MKIPFQDKLYAMRWKNRVPLTPMHRENVIIDGSYASTANEFTENTKLWCEIHAISPNFSSVRLLVLAL